VAPQQPASPPRLGRAGNPDAPPALPPIPRPRSRGVDPRFDPGVAGGPSNPQDQERQRKRYAFLYDEVVPQEVAALKQRLKVGARAVRRAPRRRGSHA
jgi:hypothetical protein